MVTWGTIHERFKYGIKKYGWNSEFNNEYQSLCMQLRYHELDEFFDNWKVPKRCIVSRIGSWNLKSLKNGKERINRVN